ncbi:hypothetical protein CYMTET_46567, partial [Cymbomonas tetramitiformis]
MGKSIYPERTRIRVNLFLLMVARVNTDVFTSEEVRQPGGIMNTTLLAAQNERYVEWYPPDFQEQSYLGDVHGSKRAFTFWSVTPPCTTEVFLRTDYPVMSDEARRSAVDLPPHGTAVITLSNKYNSKQQHTFHRYYARHFGAENLYVGIHIHEGCQMNKLCNSTKAVRSFRPTPTMIKMMSMGSKLIATYCGVGHRIGQITTDFANRISELLRGEYGYVNVIFAE